MTDIPPSVAREVVAFWFAGALESAAAAQARSKTWFSFDARFDAEILRRFGHLPEQAAAGNLDPWADAAESALARLIVLDQFPRNLYRHDSRSFVFDALAVAGSQAALASGYDALVHPLQAVFMYLPLEHAEDLAMQQRSVALFEALQARAPAGCASLFESYSDYARRHRDIIVRFGRFPHRNAVLGRADTAAEIEYLDSGGERFGPKAR